MFMDANAVETRVANWKISALAVLVVLSNVIGNCFLNMGVKAWKFAGWSSVPAAVASPALLTGVLFLMAWLFLRMALLSNGPMTLVLPVTAGFGYLLTGGIGQFWFAEKVSVTYDYGLILIAVGVWLVGNSASGSPSKT